MRRSVIVSLCVLLGLCTWIATVGAKRPTSTNGVNPPPIPIAERAFQTAAGGTSWLQHSASQATVLGSWDFDTPEGAPDMQGWITVDRTVQLKKYWHVAGTGCPDAIVPVNGIKSMWCGQWSTALEPWCGWAELPGYGNNWDQRLECTLQNVNTIAYAIAWDCEDGYDFAYLEWWDPTLQSWVPDEHACGDQGAYTGTGGPYVEGLSSPYGATKVRFRFTSDWARSDQDGLSPTVQGAVAVDDISINGGPAELFESAACGAQTVGNWTATAAPGFGLYAALHKNVVQEDPTYFHDSHCWGFFDDPQNANYACGGWPQQGAMPFGPDAGGLYLHNEVWSPWTDITGSGDQYWLSFRVYRDLPLDNLQFYTWHVRTKDAAGCPTEWMTRTYQLPGTDEIHWHYYGQAKDWALATFDISEFVPSGAEQIQVALGAVDMCARWCGVYGWGHCHSHAPLFDDVEVVREDYYGPQWSVGFEDLFQDNFAEVSGPNTGKARADAARDIAPWGSPYQPQDVVKVKVYDRTWGIGSNSFFPYTGKAVYAIVWVKRPLDKPDFPPTGAGGLQSPDERSGALRFPYVNVSYPGPKHVFRMDQFYADEGEFTEPVPDTYCFDLNDEIFEPGDKIFYVFTATNDAPVQETSWWSRKWNGQGEGFFDKGGAASSPCEFTILPTGNSRILYVDRCDAEIKDDVDRFPMQKYWDDAFYAIGLSDDDVDRFDVLNSAWPGGPGGLESLVKSIPDQIIAPYKVIIWSAGSLQYGVIGDGAALSKSDDFALLLEFLRDDPDNPGVYLSGDDIAEEWWNELPQGGARVNLLSTFMNFTLVNGDHRSVLPDVNPTVRGTGGLHPPVVMGVLDAAGFPPVNNFDVLSAAGLSTKEMEYLPTGQAAQLMQHTTNNQAATATVILDGFNALFWSSPGPWEALANVLTVLDEIPYMVTGIEPASFANRLDNAYPNPFNPATTIKYSIAEQGHVTLNVYNVAGQLVRRLVNEAQSPQAGGFVAEWNGTSDAGTEVSSGVYFYRLEANGFKETKKMVLLK